MSALTKEQEAAVDAVLEYALWDEAKHYDGERDHIFRHLFVLARLRGWKATSPRKLQAELLGEMEVRS
jgi:hypothetical protein